METTKIEGTLRETAGNVKEAVGSIAGDTKMQLEGAANELRGKAHSSVLTPAIWPATPWRRIRWQCWRAPVRSASFLVRFGPPAVVIIDVASGDGKRSSSFFSDGAVRCRSSPK